VQHLRYEDKYVITLNPHIFCEKLLLYILKAVGKTFAVYVQDAD
jgi:hypothetical protein